MGVGGAEVRHRENFEKIDILLRNFEFCGSKIFEILIEGEEWVFPLAWSFATRPVGWIHKLALGVTDIQLRQFVGRIGWALSASEVSVPPVSGSWPSNFPLVQCRFPGRADTTADAEKLEMSGGSGYWGIIIPDYPDGEELENMNIEWQKYAMRLVGYSGCENENFDDFRKFHFVRKMEWWISRQFRNILGVLLSDFTPFPEK